VRHGLFLWGRRRSRFGTAEDITVEEHNRRADLADARMQTFKRQIGAKLRADGPSPKQKAVAMPIDPHRQNAITAAVGAYNEANLRELTRHRVAGAPHVCRLHLRRQR
jgi:hypothetical protein